MAEKEIQTKLETYGEHRNPQTVFRVILFFVLLVTFVVFLSFARQPIVNKFPNSPITGLLTQNRNAIVLENKEIVSGEKIQRKNILDELPENSRISLVIGTDNYIVGKSKIEKGKAEDTDITITLPTGYSLEGDICELVRKARNNGELSIEMHKSKTALMIKYRNLLNYRNCLG